MRSLWQLLALWIDSESKGITVGSQKISQRTFLSIVRHPSPKTKTASGKKSRKPRGFELQRGGYRTGSSSFPPQVDVTIVPFQTDQQGCSSLTDCCAVVKGRMPVDQLVELEQAQLLELVLELAVLIL